MLKKNNVPIDFTKKNSWEASLPIASILGLTLSGTMKLGVSFQTVLSTLSLGGGIDIGFVNELAVVNGGTLNLTTAASATIQVTGAVGLGLTFVGFKVKTLALAHGTGQIFLNWAGKLAFDFGPTGATFNKANSTSKFDADFNLSLDVDFLNSGNNGGDDNDKKSAGDKFDPFSFLPGVPLG